MVFDWTVGFDKIHENKSHDMNLPEIILGNIVHPVFLFSPCAREALGKL